MPAIGLPRFTFSGRRTTVSAAILVVLLAGLSWSQAVPAQPQSSSASQSAVPPQQSNQPATPAQPASPQNPPQPGTTQVPGAGATVDNQQSGNDQTQADEQPEPQTRITKAQAKELFRSVDQILQFVSQDTSLPIEHKVKRNLITRESEEK